MEINVLEQLKEIVQAFAVNTNVLTEDSNLALEWDSRIYKAVGLTVEFEDNFKDGISMCEKGTIYVVRDKFETVVIVFAYEGRLVAIGPFITETAEEIMPYVIQNNEIPEEYHSELREIYNTYPLITNLDTLEDIVLIHVKYLYPDIPPRKLHLDRVRYSATMFDEIQKIEENRLSMEAIDARYKIEERFMAAVRSGDYEKVMEVANEFNNYRMSPRSKDALRDIKNQLVILNTLLRRAVQESQVHPAHIDRVSSTFAKRIETATKKQETVSIAREMPRKYCLLVKNYSLEGYSELMRDTLNYIDFNLKEDLSLNAIAARFSVNPSYLSKQFKKEMGKNLTDYVNQKRITTSLKYLATTDYPIQSIAEMVGIYDENYYSRLFRKYESVTPTKYRRLMKN